MTQIAIARALETTLRQDFTGRGSDKDELSGRQGTGGQGQGARYVAIAAMLLGLLALTTPGASASVRRQACFQRSGTWCRVGNMAVVREGHTATLLPNGMVLIAGGDLYSCPGTCPAADSSQLYNPTTQQFQFTTGPMQQNRIGHTATLLPNGEALVVGGFDGGAAFCSAELYDPNAGLWTFTGSLHTCRAHHTATLLPNGEVLVAGGDSNNNSVSSAELYNPATGAWTVTGSLNMARAHHSAALLPDGTVLVAGGVQGTSTPLSSAEIYNPATGAWTNALSMSVAREAFPLITLPFGILMAIGGDNQAVDLASTAMYYGSMWTTSSAMATPRTSETATLLPNDNNTVLVAGGLNGTNTLASAELYNPFADTWSPTGSMITARAGQTATLLQNGQVLVTGGLTLQAGMGNELASAEIYTP